MTTKHSATFNVLTTTKARILNRTAEAYVYGTYAAQQQPDKSHWSDESMLKRIKTAFTLDPLHIEIDLYELSPEEISLLGFGRWNEESHLYLIPLWMVPFLPEELELTCIDGSKEQVKNIDTDHRFGNIAYGFIPRSAPVTYEPILPNENA